MISNHENRNRDFVALCRREFHELAMQRGVAPEIREVVARVMSRPAPTYYVDYDNAYNTMVKALRRGGPERSRYMSSDWRCDMYDDLLHLLRTKPKVPLSELIMSLLQGLAGSPSFYFTRRTAMKILRPHIHNIRSL